MVLAAIFAEFITPYGPEGTSFEFMLTAPNWAHLMGTDEFGRDIFSRVIFGRVPRLPLVSPAPSSAPRWASSLASPAPVRRAVRPDRPAHHRCLPGLPADHYGLGDHRHLRPRHDPGDYRHHAAVCSPLRESSAPALWRCARCPMSTPRAQSASPCADYHAPHRPNVVAHS